MIKILDIITNPNPSLRQSSKVVSQEIINSKDFQNLCADMIETMLKKDGVGLAAPQIGKNIRVIIINTKNGPLCMLNPKILKRSLRKEWGEEGCLSVPEYFGEVKRHKNLRYEFLDAEGNLITDDAKGFMARVLQHEIDHLDGILFIDKARNLKKIK